jgi:RHS repeat-associated protein
MGGWAFYSGIEAGSVSYRTYPSSAPCSTSTLPYTNYWYFTWTDPQGTVHPFPGVQTLEYNYVPPNCTPALSGVSQKPTSSGYASDGSGYFASVTNYTNVVITDKEGNQFSPAVIDSHPPSTTPEVYDSNGNYWSQDSNGNLIDTLGRTPVLVSQSGNQIYYDVLGFNGVRNRYTVTTETVSYNTSFGESAVTEASGSFTAIQSISLPDGSAYSFTYDSGTGAGNYGELTSVTLPSGGVIQYTYTNFLDSFKNVNRWVQTRVKDGGTTKFTPSTISNCTSGNGCQEKTVVTDPSNNDTVYTFTLDAGNVVNAGSWNSAVDAYTGLSNQGGTLVKSADTSYTYSSSPVQLNEGGVVQVVGNYLVPSTITANMILRDVGYPSQTVTTLDPTGTVPTLTKVWDYYAGSPPSTPSLQTNYSYYGFYPSQVTTSDGNSNKVSQTTYSYDQGSLTSVSPTHSGAPTTVARQNLTTIARWVNTSNSTINTTATYDTAGTLLSSTDPNGTTTYGHDATDTFVTAVTPPTPSSGVTLTYGSTYDPSTGLLLTSTDPNSTQAQATYVSYDWAGRPIQINYLNDGEMYASYSATEIGVEHLMNSSAWTNTQTLLDGYGRTSRVAVGNGQATNPYYQTDYCYDTNGRLQFQSYRYQGNGWATTKVCSGSGDTYTYDGLSRPKTVGHSDGTSYTYSYTGRAVETKDESGVQRILLSGVFGQPEYVCEISSATLIGDRGSPVNCGLDIPGTGFLTTYGFSFANHTTVIAQGSQTRTFQTDSLGRITSVVEPESGTTNYSYQYSGVAGYGLYISRTGSAPTLNQQYDSLGRVVGVGSTDGTVSKGFQYDVTDSQWSNSSSAQNLKGRLAETWTGSSTGSLYSYDVMGRVTNLWECAPSTCGTSGRTSRPLSFQYDYVGDLTSEGDGVSGIINYTYSSGQEVTSITNATYGGTYNPSNLVSNVVNGPFGPISWSLGNGHTAVNAFDSMGRRTGFWVCNGSTQPTCAGQGGPYGFVISPQGERVTSGTDTTMGPFTLGYDDFNRLTSVNRYSGAQTFADVYDRYGNRWQQNAPQGGPTLSVSFNAATNQINTSGFTYNAAGRITNDTFHSYTYDADGNLLTVDGGSTAQYVYDALNHRVKTQDASGTNEYLYDLAGRRISTWVASSNFGSEGRIYWGNQQLAFRSSDGTTYFDHQDWTATERVRTNYAGSTAALYASFAFGDRSYAFDILNPSSGYNQDNAFYAGLDYDSGSGTDHAMFREYTPLQGRWMSPDPDSGSYDQNNPQSFNRYSYVMNNPVGMTDPSGLFTNGAYCGDSCSGGDGGGAFINLFIDFGEGIAGLFGHGPSFHGTLSPRPSTGNSGWDGNFGESLGIPTSIPRGSLGIALGLPSQDCEFGACGNDPNSLGPGNQSAAYGALSSTRNVYTFYGGFFLIYQKYRDMISANTKGADRFFHCTAMYDSTSLGPGGYGAAVTASWGREIGDTFKYQIRRLWGNGLTLTDSLTDSKGDLQADYRGINGAINSEAAACSGYWVRGLPK